MKAAAIYAAGAAAGILAVWSAYSVARPRYGRVRISSIDARDFGGRIVEISARRYPLATALLDSILFRPCGKIAGFRRPDHWFAIARTDAGRFLCAQMDWRGNVTLTGHDSEMAAEMSSVNMNSIKGRLRYSAIDRSAPAVALSNGGVPVEILLQWIKARDTKYKIWSNNCQTMIRDFLERFANGNKK